MPWGDHVDHVGLGKDGTDAADYFGIVSLLRQCSHLVLRDAQIARDILKKLSRAQRTSLSRRIVSVM